MVACASPFALGGTEKTPFGEGGRVQCSGSSCLAALASWEFGLVLCTSGKNGLKLFLSVLGRYNHLNPCSAFGFVLQR